MREHFKDFHYSAAQLSAYVFSIDTFIISLKDGRIVQYVAKEPQQFEAWLKRNGVRNINDQIGTMVYKHYFNT